jgi:hypothetical protein
MVKKRLVFENVYKSFLYLNASIPPLKMNLEGGFPGKEG